MVYMLRIGKKYVFGRTLRITNTLALLKYNALAADSKLD